VRFYENDSDHNGPFIIIIVPMIGIGACHNQLPVLGVFIPIIGCSVFLVWLGCHQTVGSVFKMEAQVSRIQETRKKLDESIDFENSYKEKSSPN
jgi:hypothetical protein